MTPDRAQRARDLYADAIGKLGPGYANTASSVRCGTYCNLWVRAGIAAIERALDEVADDGG